MITPGFVFAWERLPFCGIDHVTDIDVPLSSDRKLR